jgi:hypothetical protein
VNNLIEIISNTPTKETLKNLYDVCNEIFKDEALFYTSEEVKELKKDDQNIFIK